MYILFVKVQVKPECVEDFIRATTDIDARSSVQVEPGCYRFDVLHGEADPGTIAFYEVYKDKDAFESHTRTDHIAKWREAIKDLTVGEMVVWRGYSRFPTDEGW